ncbi:hypothetical protein MTR_2g086210 [Medicago truncatula]|uniref:Reverse transcriptase zinc-binding domain-containing protein n=1 Tax=Medicago truncatula TaxID=3880 RepID=G7ITQ6_MEDTR|nr:hypothetical protein MTR_2g086210 [Medicago truncatula]
MLQCRCELCLCDIGCLCETDVKSYDFGLLGHISNLLVRTRCGLRHITTVLWRSSGWTGKGVFRQIWKSGAPSKVIDFAWKALRDRILTQVNLDIRNCLPPDIGSNCVWCVSLPNLLRIFFFLVIWRRIFG